MDLPDLFGFAKACPRIRITPSAFAYECLRIEQLKGRGPIPLFETQNDYQKKNLFWLPTTFG